MLQIFRKYFKNIYSKFKGVTYLSKKVFRPIELDLKESDLDKTNWLRSCLERMEKGTIRVESESASDLVALDVEKLKAWKNKKDIEISKFKKELNQIISCDTENKNINSMNSKRLINFGNSVKVANTSSKSCILC